MIAHNWLASRWRTIPGLPCPARPSMPCQAHHHLLRSHQPGCTKTANAAAGGTTTMLHNSCLAPPCTSTSSLVHFTTTKPATSPQTLPSANRKGGVATPQHSPLEGRGRLSANMRIWRRAILRPMAARPCSPAPGLGNVLVMPTLANSCQL